MAIDHPHSGGRYGKEHQTREQAYRLRSKLEDMGIRVKDMKYRIVPRYSYLDVTTLGSPMSSKIATEYEDDDFYVVDWTLEVGDRTANDFVELAEKCSWFENRLTETEKQKNLANTDLRALRERIKKLERTLKENPGIREQWDEMMTMLKLAGYTDNLIE